MLLENVLLASGVGSLAITAASKMIRTKIPKDLAEKMEKNGLYHITTESSAEKIIESQHIKPTGRLFSYGKKACFMFDGIPSVADYIKNLGGVSKLLNENNHVIHAVRLTPPKEEIQNHYLMRSFNDKAILFEGECIFEQDRAKQVQLVLDAKLNEKGENELYFRERTEEEIKENPEGIPTEELKQILQEYAQNHGYANGNIMSFLSTMVEGLKAEYSAIWNGIKDFIQRENIPELDENEEQRLERLLDNGILVKNIPVHNKQYTQNKLQLQQRGLKQYYVGSIINSWKTSEYGEFLKEKLQRTREPESRYKTMLAVAIAQNGNITELKRRRNLDILVSALGEEKENLTYANGRPYEETDKSIVAVLRSSKNHQELDRNIAQYRPEQQETIQQIFAMYQDVQQLTELTQPQSKQRLNFQKLNLDIARQMVDFSFQMRELVSMVPTLENMIGLESKEPPQEITKIEISPEQYKSINREQMSIKRESDTEER